MHRLNLCGCAHYGKAPRLNGGLWLGFLSGGIAYLKDGQVRASYNVADGMGRGEVSDL